MGQKCRRGWSLPQELSGDNARDLQLVSDQHQYPYRPSRIGHTLDSTSCAPRGTAWSREPVSRENQSLRGPSWANEWISQSGRTQSSLTVTGPARLNPPSLMPIPKVDPLLVLAHFPSPVPERGAYNDPLSLGSSSIGPLSACRLPFGKVDLTHSPATRLLRPTCLPRR